MQEGYKGIRAMSSHNKRTKQKQPKTGSKPAKVQESVKCIDDE